MEELYLEKVAQLVLYNVFLQKIEYFQNAKQNHGGIIKE